MHTEVRKIKKERVRNASVAKEKDLDKSEILVQKLLI